MLRIESLILFIAAASFSPLRSGAQDTATVPGTSVVPAVVPATDTLPGANTGAAIDVFMDRDEPANAWSVASTETIRGATRVVGTLTSQTWNGGDWTHDVRIIWPKDCRHPDTAILWINGGVNGRPPKTSLDAMSLNMAVVSGMPVMTLFQVPNQPLMDGKYEDALIAATWLKYLETKNAQWPLLFPMVKSAVKAMDAVNEISKQHFDHQSIDKFIVTGASKRGWTSWLSAVADPRVIGIAPMVIDTLNFRKQMQDQKLKWGDYSEQIDDYTKHGLISEGEEPDDIRELREMMDPYEYLDRLTVPKLLVHGANDRYWRCDALDNYWSDLSPPKNVLTIPNAGHSLKGGHQDIATTIAVFSDRCASGKPMPIVQWRTSIEESGRTVDLSCESDSDVMSFAFWVALSANRDFREAIYTRHAPTSSTAKTARLSVQVPEGKEVAIFASVRLSDPGGDFTLSTGVSQPELR